MGKGYENFRKPQKGHIEASNDVDQELLVLKNVHALEYNFQYLRPVGRPLPVGIQDAGERWMHI